MSKEDDVRVGTPIATVMVTLAAIALVYFVPTNIVFWLFAVMSAIGIGNYLVGWNNAVHSGRLTLHLKADQRAKRAVFLRISFFGSITLSLIVCGIGGLVQSPIFSWDYVWVLAASLGAFSISMSLWTLTRLVASIERDTDTRAAAYTSGIKSAVYAILVQYVAVKFILGESAEFPFLIISLATAIYIFWLKASLYFNRLGYHSSDKW